VLLEELLVEVEVPRVLVAVEVAEVPREPALLLADVVPRELVELALLLAEPRVLPEEPRVEVLEEALVELPRELALLAEEPLLLEAERLLM
jgi:hypothetical protein